MWLFPCPCCLAGTGAYDWREYPFYRPLQVREDGLIICQESKAAPSHAAFESRRCPLTASAPLALLESALTRWERT